MATGDDHQGAVLFLAIVERNADRQEVIIGVRIKRPILVPFDSRPVFRRFDVNLVLRRTEAHGPSDQRRNIIDNGVATRQRVEFRMIADRPFEEAPTGSVRPMAVLQVKEVAALLDTLRHCGPLIRNFAKSRERVGIGRFREHEISVRFVKFDLYCSEPHHGNVSLTELRTILMMSQSRNENNERRRIPPWPLKSDICCPHAKP